MIESARERAQFDRWGDFATAGAARVQGRYDEPQAEVQLVNGTAPVFSASRAALEGAGITLQSTIERIDTHAGQVRGPFRVVRWDTETDGAFIALGLQQI